MLLAASDAAHIAAEASAEKERAEAAAAAEKARSTGYTALCKELVEAGHYPAKGNVTATMNLMHLSYSVAEHDAIKAKLIEQAAIVAAAMISFDDQIR